MGNADQKPISAYHSFPNKIMNRQLMQLSTVGYVVVEARGIEPLSEKYLPKLSTSVSDDLFSVLRNSTETS